MRRVILHVAASTSVIRIPTHKYLISIWHLQFQKCWCRVFNLKLRYLAQLLKFVFGFVHSKKLASYSPRSPEVALRVIIHLRKLIESWDSGHYSAHRAIAPFYLCHNFFSHRWNLLSLFLFFFLFPPSSLLLSSSLPCAWVAVGAVGCTQAPASGSGSVEIFVECPWL